ncbi:hypothetical protein WJX73_009221 [Symbiochloris irregularis]|uniref:Fungal lipase-type domain-containing protein n=1 Tax=Symbiochloris irregularis TaxID=706552 RepID=A0AAW1NSD3_9CHLO
MEQLRHQLEKLGQRLSRPWRQAINVICSRAAFVIFWAASQLPAVSLLFFSAQWGPGIQSLYFLWARERYWTRRLRDSWGSPEIALIGLQTLQLFLSRIDFMARFVLSLVYGNAWVPALEQDNADAGGPQLQQGDAVPLKVPQLFSTVAYCNMSDGQANVEAGPKADAAPSFVLKEGCFAAKELQAITESPHGAALDAHSASLPLYILVEASWLAYEEALVCHHILTDPSYGWSPNRDVRSVSVDSVAIVEFVGVEYYNTKQGSKVEFPLDTQCLLFKKGNAILLAFRGTQPLNFVDWLSDLTLATSHTGCSYAAMGQVSPAELAGGDRHQNWVMPFIKLASRTDQGRPPVKVKLHQGFASALGLELSRTADPNDTHSMKPQAFTCFYHSQHGFGPLNPAVPDPKTGPDVYSLPKDTTTVFEDSYAAANGEECKSIGSPYAFISLLVKSEMEKNPNAQLYVTGHSLGGALATVFATKFASDSTMPASQRVHLCTFGQPTVGSQAFINIMAEEFASDAQKTPRYARVVNRNDAVARVPPYFPDTGRQMMHLNGPGVVWYLGADKALQGGPGRRLPGNVIPIFQDIIAWGYEDLSKRTNAAAATFADHLSIKQQEILEELQQIDGLSGSRTNDSWSRSSSDRLGSTGHGVTAVIEGGRVLEKAAVNTTIISGHLTAARAKAISTRGTTVKEGQQYSAAALSLVVHPANPHVPTLRADVRQFQVQGDAWFGGGCDLTPAYLYDDDSRAFHSFWRQLCDSFDAELYPHMKQACDAYFYLPSRAEHRGTGGIFFDDFRSRNGLDAEQFARAVLDGIIPSWREIAEKRRDQPVSPEQRKWQLQRRGRYIEFNLLYDRGVKFGLEGGRVESVMVSAPPLVAWNYNVQPAPGSPEAALLEVLRRPKQWA